jgi:opacity protein-like surface antigen
VGKLGKYRLTILATSFISISISSAHANWLLGASVGYTDTNGTLSSNIAYLDPTGLGGTLSNINKEIQFTNNTWLLGFFVGYQWICNQWLTGVELGLDWYDTYDPQDFVLGESLGYEGKARYKHDAIVSLTGRLGYTLKDYLIPYIRLGAEASRDHLDVTYFSPIGIGAGNAAFIASIPERNTYYRLVGGIGLEVLLYHLSCNFIPELSVRVEYDYHGLQRAISGSIVRIDSINPPVANQQYSVNYKPHMNTGKLSIVWNFD